MGERETHGSQISRRKILERIGAGTALVWAAPAVTSLGSKAFAGDYPPPPNGCPGGSESGGIFTVPAGCSVTFDDPTLSACNDLTWGYQLDGVSTDVNNKPGGCDTQTYADLTIGPFESDRTLRVFLRDNSCEATYFSDGTPVDHATVAGTDPGPWQVAIRDAGGFCEVENSPSEGPNLSVGVAMS
jgi:hypothetical protein